MNRSAPEHPVIAIAGMPRVGSMWTFNIARSLTAEARLNLLPVSVPKSDKDMAAAAESYLRTPQPKTRCIIKVHALIKPSPDFLVIRNTRDLRDRLYSYANFMNIPVAGEWIRRAAERTAAFDRHYDAWPADRILNISFDRIEADSLDVIRQIREFIGIPDPGEKTIAEIDFRHSKQQVKQRIAELEDRVRDRDGNVRDDADPDTVLQGFSRVRAFDVDSGFQSGHVTDYRPGDWQSLWTEPEKRIVDDAIRAAERGDGMTGR